MDISDKWFRRDKPWPSELGQGVASSNLASPTVKDLVVADLLGCMKAPKTLKMGQLLRVAPTIWAYGTAHRRMSLTEFHVAAPLLLRGVSRNQIHTSSISCRRQHSPTVALVDQGPGPGRPGGSCPRFAAGRLRRRLTASQVRAP
jgi:hypothetical protein